MTERTADKCAAAVAELRLFNHHKAAGLVERLTAERDEAFWRISKQREELARVTAERDEARAALAVYERAHRAGTLHRLYHNMPEPQER